MAIRNIIERNDCYSVDNFREANRTNRHYPRMSYVTYIDNITFAPQKCDLMCYWMMLQFTYRIYFPCSMEKKILYFIQCVSGHSIAIRCHSVMKFFVQFKILFQSQSIKFNRHSRLTWVNLFTVTINSIAVCWFRCVLRTHIKRDATMEG